MVGLISGKGMQLARAANSVLSEPSQSTTGRGAIMDSVLFVSTYMKHGWSR
jgi:hypothetical protein